ncbi:MAG: immunity 8 family protein, partial [Treponema sp.]|nr:immunity 8 family protein [Treponema sp.]
MKIELKELFCMEWEFNREIMLGSEKAYSVTAYIGPADSEASNAFYVTVCNIEYVKKKIQENGCFNGLWHLIMENPKRETLEKYFQGQIDLLSEKTWEDYYQKLRLIGQSEFEDYQEGKSTTPG